MRITITMNQDNPGSQTGMALPGDLRQLPCTLGNRFIQTVGDALEVIDALEWALCQETPADFTVAQRGKVMKGRMVIADVIGDLQHAAQERQDG